MKAKKIAVILFAFLIAFSILLTGCKAKTEEETTAPTKEEATKAPATQETQETTEAERAKEGVMYLEGLPIVDAEDNIKLTIGINHAENQIDFNEEGPLSLMSGVTGIDITYQLIESAEATEKTALMLATGDYPDAFIGLGMIASSNTIWKYAQEGIFVPLTEYIDTYCPNIQHVFEQYPSAVVNATAPDGNIYSLPNINDDGKRDIRGTLFVNQTWLDNLSLDLPVTTDDYVDMLKAFRDNDANGNGDPDDEIPLECCGFRICNSYQDILGAFGVMNLDKDDPYAIIDGKVINEIVTDNYKTALKYMNTLWNEDLMDIETFTQDWATYKSKFQNADEEIMVGSMVGYVSYDAIVRELGLETYTCIEPLVGPDGTQFWRRYPKGVQSAHVFVMTDACEYPEVMMRLLDTWNTEQWAVSGIMGLEGVQWDYNEDGKIVKYDHSTVEYEADPKLNFAVVTHWKGPWCLTREIRDNMININMQDEERIERLSMYEPFLQDESTVYPVFTFFTEEDSERLSIIESDIANYAKQMEADFIMNGNIDERWDEFLAELENIGLSEAIEIRQNALDNQ